MKLFALALVAFLFTSCAGLRSAIDKVTENGALVAPVVSIVTSLVFDKAVSEEDKAEKAAIISKLADKIADVELVAKPTREEFEKILLESLPAKTHWIALASTLSTQYDKATKNISDEDVAKTIAVIKEISFGLKSATARYIVE